MGARRLGRRATDKSESYSDDTCAYVTGYAQEIGLYRSVSKLVADDEKVERRERGSGQVSDSTRLGTKAGKGRNSLSLEDGHDAGYK